MKKYDIFISYRRSSYDVANLIATRLNAAGYSVFFDMEKLRSGKFNEQLFDVIDHCTDFVLVLPPSALDRCVNEDDWVRLEVCRAMEKKKIIIPVMLNGFTWPTPMPAGMEEVPNYQALTASSVEYFDLAMERLQKKYLLSKRQLPIVRLLKYAGVFISTLLVLLGILYGVFIVLSKDVCTKHATIMMIGAGNVHVIAEENDKLAKDWEDFDNAISREHRQEKIIQLQEDMLERIDLAEKNVTSSLLDIDTAKMEIAPYHSFLLSLHGIDSENLAVAFQIPIAFRSGFLETLFFLRETVKSPIALNRRGSIAFMDNNKHQFNSYYASFLADLSVFPKWSRKAYDELSKDWNYFPLNYEIGRDMDYYLKIMRSESELADEALTRFSTMLELQDAAIEDLEKKLDDSTMGFVDKFRKLENDAVQSYEKMKTKCTIEEADGQWHKWGKIRRWGSYLANLAECRNALLKLGTSSSSQVTLDKVYNDMKDMLDLYCSNHPESREYVASSKLYFGEVATGNREHGGVLVYAFKDDAVHPCLKKGDIIVGYDGKPVKNYDELKVANSANSGAKMIFLRIVDGRFKAYEETVTNTDIIGFLELTEE